MLTQNAKDGDFASVFDRKKSEEEALVNLMF